MAARIEAILTELVFEHALRIRMTAESSVSTSKQDKGKQPASAGSKIPGNGNLVGKINNLVTTDLAIANSGRDWLMGCTSFRVSLAKNLVLT